MRESNSIPTEYAVDGALNQLRELAKTAIPPLRPNRSPENAIHQRGAPVARFPVLDLRDGHQVGN